MRQGLVSAEDYNRLLFIALGTLIATPELLRLGLRWTSDREADLNDRIDNGEPVKMPLPTAVIIGGGRLGWHAAEELRRRGCEVRVIDTSPVNLHRFALAGHHTVTGDARIATVLKHAVIEHAGLVMVFVSQDQTSLQIVQAVRDQNVDASLLVRCRFHNNIEPLQDAGCNTVICDESEATHAIKQILANLNLEIHQAGGDESTAA